MRLKDRATAYAEDVLNGCTPANKHIKNAAQRFVDDLTRQDTEAFGFYYDEEEAVKSMLFFEGLLKLSGGDYEAQPFKLLPWQSFLISNIYGWKSKKTGYRRFKKAYIETAKGSGKSPLVAGMALKAICADGEPGAEGYVIARTSDQSLVTFRSCVNMVNLCPELSEPFDIYGGATSPWQLTYKNRSFLRRVSSDTKGRHSGPIPHIVVVDEYHEHDNSSMRDNYAAGVKNRRQPLVLIITNSGVSLQSPCGQEHQLAKSVLEGSIQDENYFALVYGVDDEDDPFSDESCWIKANPSLCLNPEDCGAPGVTSIPGYEYVRQQVKEAEGMPSKKSVVNRLNFCRWVDAADPWIDLDIFRENEVKELSSEEERAGVFAWIGLDLSARTDLTAGCICWDFGDRIEVESRVWTPADTLFLRTEQESMPYNIWAEAGHIKATPGAVVQFDYVAAWIKDCAERFKIGGVAYDPWRIHQLEQELDEHGVATDRQPGGGLLMIPHPQGFISGYKPAKYRIQDEARGFNLWMPRSIEHFEGQILARNLRVKVNPVLRMAFSGCVVIADASNNRRLTKTKSLTRIDPAMAMVMAVGAAVESRQSTAWRPIEDISTVFGGL